MAQLNPKTQRHAIFSKKLLVQYKLQVVLQRSREKGGKEGVGRRERGRERASERKKKGRREGGKERRKKERKKEGRKGGREERRKERKGERKHVWLHYVPERLLGNSEVVYYIPKVEYSW